MRAMTTITPPVANSPAMRNRSRETIVFPERVAPSKMLTRTFDSRSDRICCGPRTLDVSASSMSLIFVQPQFEDQVHEHRLGLSNTLVVVVTDGSRASLRARDAARWRFRMSPVGARSSVCLLYSFSLPPKLNARNG